MACYKNGSFLTHLAYDTDFDTLHEPGDPTPWSGIYRCRVCAHEVISTQRHPLPPENHHVHPPYAGPIRWQLIVSTQSNK